MKIFRRAVLLVALVAIAGCRAHMITIKLINTSAAPLSTIIVDYPSATFGKDKLASGETFSSPVKLIDTGPLKVQFTDANGTSHTVTGPVVHRNEEGLIEVRLDQNGAVVDLHAVAR